MPTVVWRDLDQDGVRDGEARYRYDHRGNVTTVWVDSNANGIPEFEARYTYDARGLLTEAWSDHYYDEQGPSRARYKYSQAGWLTDGEEAVGDAAPHRKVKYRYDAAGRIRSSSTGDAKSEIHYEHDAAGNLVREWSAKWQKRYTYDAQHRVTRVWTDANPGPVQHEERRTYDAAGRLVQTASGSGGKLAHGHFEYDAAGRQIRVWSDLDGDGSPESDTRTTYDASGRTLAVHEDRDGNGKPDVSHGTDYNADGLPTRRWRDTDGDGRPNQETVSTYDQDGHLIAEVTFENRRPSGEVRWEYKDGKAVRWWNPLHTNVGARYTYDAAGNVAVQIEATTGATHYEYDVAALAALHKTAPAQCTAASAPYDHPTQRALALDPQRAGPGWLQVHKAAPGPIAAPKAPALPTLDAAGYLTSSEPHALVDEYERYVDALREQAFADRGWKHVAIHRVKAGARSRYIRGVRVAKAVRECGEPSQYMIDRDRKVFEPNPAVRCNRQIVVKVRGTIAAGGCGTEPPAVDLYAEVADGARAETGTRPLPITIPVCLEFRPDGGFSHPP
jgi:YD repeat-containing protein